MSEEDAKTEPPEPPKPRFAWQARQADHVFATLSCELCGNSSKHKLRGLDFGQISRYFEKHRACKLPETPETPEKTP